MANLSAGFSLNNDALTRLNSLNLDEELEQIQRMVEGGIVPSAERLKEYLQAACHQGGVEKDKVILCISDILVVLEANQNPAQLKEVFLRQG